MSSTKPPKGPSGPPPWNLDEEMSGSEDVSFEDWPPEAGILASPLLGEKRPSYRPTRKTIPPEVPGWPPAEGTILLGKYKIDKILGKGGMGVVVVARHLQLEQKVAIKFLHPAAMADPDVVIRFAREARVLAQIQSEHVVRILDVGQLAGGEPYMVMEFLEGTDLSRAVKVRGPLPLEEAVDYAIQACEPLAEAHVLNIIHRDLKPSNLYLARRADGTYTIKVIDFGISKVAASETELSMTKTSVILGSPLYISPEQLRSAKDVDARSDIWALGVIMYKLLTGHPPFMADTIAQLCAMILLNPPPRITEARPDLPQSFEAVLARCIHKDPDQRFQNVGQLSDALAPFLAPDAEAHDSVLRIRRLLKTTAPKDAPSGALPDLGSGPLPPPSGSWSEGQASNPSLPGANVVTDGGASHTLGGSAAEAAIENGRKQRQRRVLATALGAALACVAAVTGVVAIVKLRQPQVIEPGHQVDQTPPQPLQPLPPLQPPLPLGADTATRPTSPVSPSTASLPVASTDPVAVTSASVPKKNVTPPPPPPAPIHRPVKPVDNTEFGGRK